MRKATLVVFGWTLAGLTLALLPAVGFGRPWVSLVLGVLVAAVLARTVARRYVGPLEQLGDRLREHTDIPPTPAADLARVAANEYRDALDRLAEATRKARRHQAALAHTADAALVIDPDGLVEYANPMARVFLADQVLDVTRRLQQPALERLVALARERGEPLAEEVTLWVPGAQPARVRVIPLADGATVLLLSDLSESYRLDRVRRDFVANVSHELKTPVAAIRALAETAATALGADDLSTAIRFVDRLGTETARLGELVVDLLDLSRVEVGGELELTPVELSGLLDEAVETARSVAEVKGISLEVTSRSGIVRADPSQLSMAVKNLVDNAVRYSEGGRVRVGAEVTDGWAMITVADEGIGIPADEAPRIFERFYRVDKARSRATGGTGLGLAIVRHVAENHGGRVDVASELGVGSTFTLLLPTDGPQEAEGSAA